MTREDKKKIERRAYWHDLLRQLRGTPDFPVKLFFHALFLVGAVYVATKQAILREQVKHIELISPILKAAMEHAVTAYLFVGGLALLTLLLYPFGRRAAKDQLQCIGLINHAGMPPDLLRKRRDKDNPRVTIWEFRNQSIPLQEWEKKCLAIETALGITIVKLAYAKGRSRVLVYSVSADDDLPEVLKWRDSYLSPKSFVLVLGESYAGPVTVNLAHIPHILLGGSTGSGKSVLLKLLLMQALHKGAEVYIADFKGGVDFPKVWHEKCRMCFTEENLRDTLDQLVAVLEYRKSAFNQTLTPTTRLRSSRSHGSYSLVTRWRRCWTRPEPTTSGRSYWRKLKAGCPPSRGRGGRSASTLFLPRRGRTQRSFPARYAITWISVFAAGRTAYFRKSYSTTPAPPNRYPRMREAVSLPETVRYFKAICSTRSSCEVILVAVNSVPIWEKANLNLEEAAAYFGIGINKLRDMTNENNCPFVLWNGNKRLIKRRAFERFLDSSYSI